MSATNHPVGECPSQWPTNAQAEVAAVADGTIVSALFGVELQLSCTVTMTLAQLQAECAQVSGRALCARASGGDASECI